MTKYLIFDFDGVLADSSKADLDHLVNSENHPDITNLIEAKHHRTHIWATQPPATHKKEGLSPDEYSKYKQFGDHYILVKVGLFQEFITEIQKLKDVKLAIVSSGAEHYIQKTLEQTDLKFEFVYGIETSPSKVAKVQKVCEQWEIEPSQAFYFTDTQADIIELRDFMGLERLIGCSWGWQGYDLLREFLPSDQILEEYFEIHRAIGNEDFRAEEKFNKNVAKKLAKQTAYEKERQRRLKIAEQKEKALQDFNSQNEENIGRETFNLFKDDKRTLSDLQEGGSLGKDKKMASSIPSDALPQNARNDDDFFDEQVDFEEEDFETEEDLIQEQYVDFPTSIIQHKKYTLLDSTGIRRPGQRTFGAESFATFRTIEEAYQADVICMVVDGSEPLAHQDQVVAGIVKEARKGVVVIVNKADLVDAENRVKFQAEFEHKFAFLKIKKFVWVSAKTGEGVKSIWDNVDLALEERNLDISRDELRRLFNYLMKRKPPKKLRLEKRPVVYDLLYDNTKTPTFELLVKNKQTIHWSYLRFLENTIRANFGFENTEIKVKAVNVSRKKVLG
jgi:phosphoglycolate phosphatase-like HAD superfamily hydrolase